MAPWPMAENLAMARQRSMGDPTLSPRHSHRDQDIAALTGPTARMVFVRSCTRMAPSCTARRRLVTAAKVGRPDMAHHRPTAYWAQLPVATAVRGLFAANLYERRTPD